MVVLVEHRGCAGDLPGTGAATAVVSRRPRWAAAIVAQATGDPPRDGARAAFFRVHSPEIGVTANPLCGPASSQHAGTLRRGEAGTLGKSPYSQ